MTAGSRQVTPDVEKFGTSSFAPKLAFTGPQKISRALAANMNFPV